MYSIKELSGAQLNDPHTEARRTEHAPGHTPAEMSHSSLSKGKIVWGTLGILHDFQQALTSHITDYTF